MPEAERTLTLQLDYLIELGAVGPAQSLKDRVEAYLIDTLAAYPRTGKHIVERDIWETWIPRTRLVAWYSFTDDELAVVAFWHTGQNRDDGTT
jgi:plasmid stabilization system protein ParE